MFYKISNIKNEQIDANSSRKILAYSKNIMYVRVYFKKAILNGTIPTHKHSQEQVTYILKGKFRFEIKYPKKTDIQEVQMGDSIYFPSNIEHGCVPLEDDSQVLDCFTPRRDDFLK